MRENPKSATTKGEIAAKQDKPRKPYSKPRLGRLGDLRTLTLGGSPGFGDSGPGQLVEKLPGT